MKTLVEQIQEKTEQRKHLEDAIGCRELNLKLDRFALEQVGREIVELQKQRDKQPQFGDFVNLVSISGESLGRRVLLYDSSGELKAFDKDGCIVGSASNGYYKCTGSNLFATMLSKICWMIKI